MSPKPRKLLTRRTVIGAGALAVMAVAVARAGWLGQWLSSDELAFRPLENPVGYRILQSGAITSGGVPLFGLDGAKPAGLIAAERRVEADLETTLFGSDPRSNDDVPIAYFFDYQCPICRQLTPRLRALTGVRISWHDLAVLGPASEVAARASIAARNQGAYDAFHDRLMRARFQATDGYVSALADSVGIDAKRLITDMKSDAVNDHMWTSRAVANRFGMVGTPGLVIGRSVIIGDISTRDLNQIIETERARGLR